MIDPNVKTVEVTNQTIKPQTDIIEDHATIELLAEQPKVDIERLAVGKVQVRKEIRTKTINLPLTLQQEVLIIDQVPNAKLAQPLPDTTLKPQDPSNSYDWDTWVKVDKSQLQPSAKIMVNGRPHDLGTEPMEVVISQEFAHVQIQTLLAETVRLTTTEETHQEQIPVTLRHEELVTEHKKFDTPQVLATQEVYTDNKKV